MSQRGLLHVSKALERHLCRGFALLVSIAISACGGSLCRKSVPPTIPKAIAQPVRPTATAMVLTTKRVVGAFSFPANSIIVLDENDHVNAVSNQGDVTVQGVKFPTGTVFVVDPISQLPKKAYLPSEIRVGDKVARGSIELLGDGSVAAADLERAPGPQSPGEVWPCQYDRPSYGRSWSPSPPEPPAPPANPDAPLPETIVALDKFPDGSPRAICLIVDTRLGNTQYPKGSIIVFGQPNIPRFIWVPKAATIAGLRMPANSDLLLWPDGTPEFVRAPDRLTIRGWTTYPNSKTRFRPDGKLWSLQLADAVQMLAGPTLPSGTWLWLDFDGVVDLLRPERDIKWGDLVVAHDKFLCLYPNGRIATVQIQSDAVLRDMLIPAGSLVSYYLNGQLTNILLSRPTQVNGLSFIDRLGFDKNGHLSAGILQSPAVLDGISCKGDNKALFQEGHLHGCWLNGDQSIRGIPCRGDSPVQLSASGLPIFATLSAPYTSGGRTYPAGYVWNARVTRTEERQIIARPTLDVLLDAMVQVTASSIERQVTSHRNEGIFGGMDLAHGDVSRFPFDTAIGGRHDLNIHFKWHFERFLKNLWPFYDCGCDCGLQLRIKFTNDGTGHFALSYGDVYYGDFSIGCGQCPLHTIFINYLVIIPGIFSLRPALLGGTVAETQLVEQVNNAIAANIANIGTVSGVLGFTITVEDIFFDATGGLTARFTYTVQLQ